MLVSLRGALGGIISEEAAVECLNAACVQLNLVYLILYNVPRKAPDNDPEEALGVASGYTNPLFNLVRDLSPKGEALRSPHSPRSQS